MTRCSLRLLMSVLCLSLLAAACSGGTPSSEAAIESTIPETLAATDDVDEVELVEVRVASLGTIDSSPVWIADSQGYFADAGIDISFIPVSEEADVAEALVNGTADTAALSATQAIKLVAAGEPLRITNYLNATSPEATRHSMTLVSTAAAGLESGCDLENARIGVNEVNSLVAHAVTQMMINDECDASTVQFVEASLTAQPGLLETGDVDAIAVFEPYTAQAVRLGFVEVANLDRELCPGLSRCPIGVVAVHDAWADENPALSEEFNRAISRALLWMESNQTEYRAELVKCCGITVDDAAAIRVFDWVGDLNALNTDLPRLMDLLEAQGKLPIRPDMADLLG